METSNNGNTKSNADDTNSKFESAQDFIHLKVRIEILDRNERLNYVMGRIRDAGFAVYAVGGCVRDPLLGLEPKDFDIATSATWETLIELFPKTKKLGQEFGTFGTVQIAHDGFFADAATFRTESGYSDFRKPDQISYTDRIFEDLERRDFTINAMAYSRWEGLVDDFDGIEDLNNKLIRTVLDPGDRFNQDALRILRAIRFSAQLDFDIEYETFNGLKGNAHLISSIPKERVRQELQKAILAKSAKRCLELLIEINAFLYMGIDYKVKLSGSEAEALMELSASIDKSENNFNKRMALILNCLDPIRAQDLARYLNLKKSMQIIK
jgi:tRNA nucleotidyltransferase (CCA-adding enzyme)